MDIFLLYYCFFIGIGAGGVIGYFAGRDKERKRLETLMGSRVSTDLINENMKLKAMLEKRDKL